MTNLDIRRHMELFNPETFTTPIHVIGAGATGSWLVLQLAKLGITNITVWDFDVVEPHNIPNQLYGLQHVGMQKVQALQDIIEEYTGTVITIRDAKFERQPLNGYVLNMVDTMSGRKDIWTTSIKFKPSIKLLIEPRMGLDMGRIYNVNPMNINEIKAYEETLYSDDEAEVSACGTSMTVISTALSVASYCVRQLIEHANGETLDNEVLFDVKYNNLITARWT